MTLKLAEAKAIADLAGLVVLAAAENAPEELIAQRYKMLCYAIPAGHVLARTLALHDKPESWRDIAASIAKLARSEANGEDISLNGATPEVRATIEKYLSDRSSA